MEKIDKYQTLKIELERLWEVQITVVPLVIGTLTAMSDTLMAALHKSQAIKRNQIYRKVHFSELPRH